MLLKILIGVLIVLVIAVVALYFFGRKAQAKQAAQQEQMEAMAQNVSMLVIDKRRMKLKEAGLPAIVTEQTPRLLRGSKLPIVKAKVGPKIMTLVCDERIFDTIPIKKEIKAVVSGIYITSVKGVRGSLEAPQKKKGIFGRMKSKILEKASQKPS